MTSWKVENTLIGKKLIKHVITNQYNSIIQADG